MKFFESSGKKTNLSSTQLRFKYRKQENNPINMYGSKFQGVKGIYFNNMFYIIWHHKTLAYGSQVNFDAVPKWLDGTNRMPW